MIRRNCFLLTVLCFSVALSDVCLAAKKNEPCVIVIPSRYTVVQFAFDISRIRPATLVAYDTESDKKAPIMHIWDKKAKDWIETNVGELGMGAIGDGAKKAILVGEDTDLPKSIEDAMVWAPKTDRIKSLSIMTLVNTLDKHMKFSPAEWTWIAERHRLKITDLNVERRRYGKYGKPGSKTKQPVQKIKDDMIPMPDETEEPVSLLPPEVEILELENKVLPPALEVKDIEPEDK